MNTPVVVMQKRIPVEVCDEFVKFVAENYYSRRDKWKLPKDWQWDPKASKFAKSSLTYDIEFQDEDLSPFISEVSKAVKEANDTNFNFQYDPVSKDCYISQYKAKDFSSWHTDGASSLGASHNVDRRFRKLTAVVQLTDPEDYTGGELEFFAYNNPKGLNPMNKGDIVVFPAWEFHQVKKITSGIRRSAVFFFHGEAFR